MDMPDIKGVDMQTVVLLGAWLFTAIQFAKGKVWPDSWTGRISLLLPFLLAWIPVSKSETLNAYAQVMAVLYLLGTGAWAINKAGQQSKDGGPTPPQP